MKLRRKILLIVTPIVVAPLFLLWVAAYLTLRPALEDSERMRQDIEELVVLLKEARQEARRRFENATVGAYAFGLANIGANLDGKLDAVEKSLLITAKRPNFIDYFSAPDEAAGRDSVRAYLEDLMRAHEIAHVSLVSPEGEVLFRLERDEQAANGQGAEGRGFRRVTQEADVADAGWFNKALESGRETSWGVYRSNGNGARGLSIVGGSIAVPGPDGDFPAGYLHAGLPISELIEGIHGPEELTSSVRLVGSDGTEYWSHGDSERVAEEAAMLNISQLIKGGVLHAEVQMPSRIVFENLAPFDRLSEALATNLHRVEVANANLESTVARTRGIVFAIKVALAAIALFLLFTFLGRVASKIEKLNGVTLRIRDGELNAPLPAFSTGDELTTLRENIDRMRLRIKGQIEKLDRKVAERTKDLNTANQRLEREVRERTKAEEVALAASRAKSDFLATMSHEIRTPLSGIFGGTHLLLKSDLNDDQRTLAKVVESSTQTLQSLVNDILDFSKIEAGKLTLDEQTFDVSSAVREVCETFRFKAEEKGLELSFEDEARDSILRIGDSTRLKQIIYNLVGNAVKFTRQGWIHVRLLRDEEEPEKVRVEIEDTGIGMSEDMLEQVFDSFTQADSSISREFGGTGLGLAISSRLAALMRGRVTVTSKIGEGSCFKLEVPLPYAISVENVQGARPISGEPQETRAHGRILFAEDNQTNRMILSRTLEATGFEVTEVADGRACVEKAREADYDLVLMDCSMPVLDGCSAARQIRDAESSGQAAGRKLIVGLTANATSAQRKDCFECGMDDVLFKPLSGSMLVETCMRLIEQVNKAKNWSRNQIPKNKS